MSRTARRVLLVLSALLALSLPLAAQVRPDQREDPAERFLAVVWERLTAPFMALWDSTAPPGSDDPEDTTDGRSTIDPLG
jgi:hypothetical protein